MNSLPHLLISQINEYISQKNNFFPVLLYSSETLIYNIKYFFSKFNIDSIYFPVKCNNNLVILKILSDQDKVNFEVASIGEIELLSKLNISPKRILYSNPVKIPEHIEKAVEYGINFFVVDSIEEVEKIKRYTNFFRILIRISVTNHGARWRLDQKFGVDKKELISILKYCQNNSIEIKGLCYHVGWCNTNYDTWKMAIEKASKMILFLKKNGINTELLDIGGGFPAHNVNQYEYLDEISKLYSSYINKLNEQGIRIIAEPGSFITANAGVLLSKVISIKQRKNKCWIYIDNGIFQGFYWILAGLEYQIYHVNMLYSNNIIDIDEYVVTGPTCDSSDIFSYSIKLPKNTKEGDVLCIFPAGAYIESAKYYNGIKYPSVKVF